MRSGKSKYARESFGLKAHFVNAGPAPGKLISAGAMLISLSSLGGGDTSH
jgi:hypothetical protein